jgi:hypothetical protein
MKPCLKTAATREQKNAGRGGIFFFFLENHFMISDEERMYTSENKQQI